MLIFFCCKLVINFLVKVLKLIFVFVLLYVMVIVLFDWCFFIIKGIYELIFFGFWEIFIFLNNIFFCKFVIWFFKNLIFFFFLIKFICGIDWINLFGFLIWFLCIK